MVQLTVFNNNYVQKCSKLDARLILTSNTECPIKSKHLLSISNNKVRVKVSVIVAFREDFVTSKRAKGHFVTLIEIHVHLITFILDNECKKIRSPL